MSEEVEEIDISDGYPAFQPPAECFDNRGQFITFLHMVDEALDSLIAGRSDPDMEPHPWFTAGEFYGFYVGGLMGSAKYIDGVIPLASEGVELTASGLLSFEKSDPPDQQEQLFWPSAIELPQALAGNQFKLSGILRRDHARDAAVVRSIVMGESTRSANPERLIALAELSGMAAEIIKPEYAFYPLLVGCCATWHAGEVELGLELLEDLALEFPDTGTGNLLKHLQENHPEGPAWMRAKKWREEAI